MKIKSTNNKGITLVTLVVTIIVLIILAGVSLHVLLKDNGIIDKAKVSQETQDIARIQESLELLKGPILIDEHEVTLDNYLEKLDTEEMREKYKVTQIERVDGANYAYVVLENKYRYKIENDPSNEDNVIITYNGPEADLLLSEYTGNFIYPETKTITVTKNASNGTLSVTSSNEDIAKATIEGNTITIASGQTTGTATITVKSTKDGNEDVAVYKAIVSQKQIKLEVEAYEGIYDGQPHNAVKITTLEPEDATVKYYLDGVDYGTTIPQVTGAKTYSISIEASKAGYTPITITETVTIGKAEVGEGNLVLSETSGTITYPTPGTFTIDTNTSGGKITVTSSDDTIATATLGTDKKTVTITPKAIETDGQKVTITVISSATDNYEEQTATYEATVDRGEITIEATPYTGTYDGQEHDALTYVKVTPEDATVTYYLDGVNKGSTIPKVTNVGQYSISIEASKAGYVTATKTDTVAEIGQQGNVEGNLTLSATSGTVTYPTAGTFTIDKNVSGGEISVSSSNDAIATATLGTDKKTVTITPKAITTDGQKVTITVKSAAKGNYGEQTATYVATVDRGTIEIEATPYTGTYDGQEHDALTYVKVTPEGSTVTYYLDGVNKGSTIPKVTNVGQYSISIEASKAGYVTATKTDTVAEIGQQGNVEGNLTLSATSGTVTYPTPVTFTVNKNVSGGEISVSSSNDAIATATLGTDKKTVTITPQILTADNQKVTITVKSAAKGNYGEQTATYVATVDRGTITITYDKPTITYDGQAHPVLTNVKVTPEDATVKYTLKQGDTTVSTGTTIPTVTDVATYSIGIEVTKAGYKPVAKTETVTPKQQGNTAGNLVLSATSGTVTYPTPVTFTVNKNVSGGDITVSSSNDAIAKATLGTDKKTVTITPQILTADNQKVTITVKSAAKGNYAEQTATYVATVNRGTITITATGYSGSYDGQEHDAVTITKKEPSDVTLKYTLVKDEETVSTGTTIPKIKDLGQYSVAIEASKAGYKSVTITKTITTMTAEASDMLDVGNFVKYTPTTKTFKMTTTQTGYSSDQTFSTGDYTGLWKVLYNDEDNGLQLISADSVGYLYLSGANGYNNVVTTLNSFSSNYVNSYASSGRSVGTNPKTPSTDTSSNVSLVFNTSTGLKAADTRYTRDVTAMQAASTLDINGYYWLPSRYVFSTSEVGYFGIYTISADGAAEYRRVKDMYVSGKSYEYTYAYGVRPVVTIKDGINVTKGNGLESSPYELGN